MRTVARGFSRTPTEVELAWMAGIIDADGCIQIHQSKRVNGRQYYQVGVSVINTIWRMVEKFQDVFPSYVMRYKAGRYKNQLRTRDCYEWKISSARAYEFLSAIRPYLIAKTEQADVALAFCRRLDRKSNPKYYRISDAEVEIRRDMYHSLRELKQRDVSASTGDN